jgi:hypothetical protein
MMTIESTLQAIQNLAATEEPAHVIDRMLPRTTTGAVTWGLRLAAFEEYRGHFPYSVIGLARVVARRAMQEHALILTHDGRVIERPHQVQSGGPPTSRFILKLRNEAVCVDYTHNYFSGQALDHFQFRSSDEPARPMPLSETGWWSQFVHHDVVEAFGGPEAFATALADAQLAGRDDEFMEVFEGKWSESARRKPNEKPKRDVVGKHTREVVDEVPGASADSPKPGSLF